MAEEEDKDIIVEKKEEEEIHNLSVLTYNDASFMLEEEQGQGDTSRITEGGGIAGLGDLSCSLLTCQGLDHAQQEGHNHDDGSFVEAGEGQSDLHMVETELKKRGDLSVQLAARLSDILKQTGEGDSALDVVEKELEKFAEGLKNSKFLANILLKTGNTETANVSSATQTEEIDLNGSVSTCASTLTPTVSASALYTQKDDQEEHSEDEEGSKSLISPRRVSFVPVNSDQLRLTFSPTIWEYEAESKSESEAHGHSRISEIEDLKLQVADLQRKLTAKQKFLDEMTAERELEREEHQRSISELRTKHDEAQRDKERMENTNENLRMEVTDLEDMLRQKEIVEQELVDKLQSSDTELKRAIDKIIELREIVRSLSEQVGSASQHMERLSSFNMGRSGDLNVGTDQSAPPTNLGESSYCETCQHENDYTEEFHNMVDDLVRKIEDKLLDLEGCLQNRPSSSCSVRSGDDVSVRASSIKAQSHDEMSESDVVSQIFCCLRRLGCSFETLTRFEEVLLKKVSDADLRIHHDANKIQDLKTENMKLKSDLVLCHQKIKQFEDFLQNNRKAETTGMSTSIERLRWLANSFNNDSPLSLSAFEHSEEKGDASGQTSKKPLSPVSTLSSELVSEDQAPKGVKFPESQLSDLEIPKHEKEGIGTEEKNASNIPKNDKIGTEAAHPSNVPNNGRTGSGSPAPAVHPSNVPNNGRTGSGSPAPAVHPSNVPNNGRTGSGSPAVHPSNVPNNGRTGSGSPAPGMHPSNVPNNGRTGSGSPAPGMHPSSVPNNGRTGSGSPAPGMHPSNVPNNGRTGSGSPAPGMHPSSVPNNVRTGSGSAAPAMHPSNVPNNGRTGSGSPAPGMHPSNVPNNGRTGSGSPAPGMHPSNVPNNGRTGTPAMHPSNVPNAGRSGTDPMNTSGSPGSQGGGPLVSYPQSGYGTDSSPMIPPEDLSEVCLDAFGNYRACTKEKAKELMNSYLEQEMRIYELQQDIELLSQTLMQLTAPHAIGPAPTNSEPPGAAGFPAVWLDPLVNYGPFRPR